MNETDILDEIAQKLQSVLGLCATLIPNLMLSDRANGTKHAECMNAAVPKIAEAQMLLSAMKAELAKDK